VLTLVQKFVSNFLLNSVFKAESADSSVNFFFSLIDNNAVWKDSSSKGFAIQLFSFPGFGKYFSKDYFNPFSVDLFSRSFPGKDAARSQTENCVKFQTPDCLLSMSDLQKFIFFIIDSILSETLKTVIELF
jgi:hypothetical protein